MILFLDIDGVLHPSNHHPDTLFERVPQLAAWLDCWPQVDVVISSSWRMHHTQKEMAEMLGQTIGARLVGSTSWIPQTRDDSVYPTSKMTTFSFERQNQIEEWMASSWDPSRAWVALDDAPYLFRPECPHIVLCKGREGLSSENVHELNRHAKAAGLTGS